MCSRGLEMRLRDMASWPTGILLVGLLRVWCMREQFDARMHLITVSVNRPVH